MSLKQKPEPERIPCIDDIVFVQGALGGPFRVAAIYSIIKQVELRPVSVFMGFRAGLTSWSDLIFTDEKWSRWCNLKDIVHRFTGHWRKVA